MWQKFFPDYYYESVFEIPYKELKQKDIKALIFDIDNTLVPYHVRRPPTKTATLLARLQKMGFKVCLLSNNGRNRMETFNEHLKLPAFHFGLKPLPGKAKQILKQINVEPQHAAIIGDQVFADVWCGKRLKLTTILIKPIDKKDAVTVRVKRVFEKFVFKSYLKKKMADEAGVPASGKINSGPESQNTDGTIAPGNA
ncbi:MAG: YqeG family HAD IIIA-type phosphatase [Clostridiales bacterium]|jgi:HAD superfamily phosphatase (TIGR01668 family)|nr:YqeG family HAD IIIA-type phosphatase [Clostridiales bacterium]